MVQGLAFLSKKSWHTKNLANQEKVWMAEQRKAAEESKTKELAKQIQQEREQEELERITGTKSKTLDRGIDWMYQAGGANTDLAKEDALKQSEEYLLGKEFNPNGSNAPTGDFADASTVNTGINAVITSPAAEPASTAATSASETNEERKASQYYDEGPSVAERNESFRVRHEDPMFVVSQKRKEKEEQLERKKALYDRVVGSKGGSNASRVDDKDDENRRSRKRDKKKSSRRKERKRDRKRHRSSRRYEEDDYDDVSSDGNDSQKKRRRHNDRKRHHNRHREEDHSRQRYHDDYYSDNSDRDYSRERERERERYYDRRETQITHPKHTSDSKDDYNRRSRSYSRSRSRSRSRSPGKGRQTYQGEDEFGRSRRKDYSPDHSRRGRDTRYYDRQEHEGYRNSGRRDGNYQQDGVDVYHRKEKTEYGDTRKDNAYGLQGGGNKKNFVSNDLGPDRNLLAKRRNQQEETRRRAKESSNRRRMTDEERAEALRAMQIAAKERDESRKSQSVRTKSILDEAKEEEESGKSSGSGRHFLSDMAKRTHGIDHNNTASQSLASRVSQNRHKNQRLNDSFL